MQSCDKKTACQILDGKYEEGIEEQFQKEKKIELVTDIVVESVIDDLVDNTAADIEAKRGAVIHLFSEPSLSQIVTPPGTPVNVIVQ